LTGPDLRDAIRRCTTRSLRHLREDASSECCAIDVAVS
jgi:hypothetical protein